MTQSFRHLSCIYSQKHVLSQASPSWPIDLVNRAGPKPLHRDTISCSDTSSRSLNPPYKRSFRAEACFFHLESFMLYRHTKSCGPKSTPNRILSLFINFKGIGWTKYLVNLTVSSIISLEALIRFFTSPKGYQSVKK